MNLQGKNVYISGGSSGIGLATASRCVRAGANVVIFARDKARLAEAEASLRAASAPGARVAALSLDVADPEATTRVLGEAAKSHGAPFLVVNSAGIGGAKAFIDESFAKFDQRMKVNVYGVRNVIAALVPSMLGNGEGHIVNVSSLAGLIGVFGFTSYAASKFAVVGFSEALRTELKPKNIWVSVYCPPDVDTPMLAAEMEDKPAETIALSANAGLMSADDAAAALLDGVRRKRFLVIPGTQSRLVHLANRWLPGLREAIVDRIVAKAQKKAMSD